MERMRSVSAGSRADSICRASSATIVVILAKRLLVPLVRSTEHAYITGKWEEMNSTYKDMGKS